MAVFCFFYTLRSVYYSNYIYFTLNLLTVGSTLTDHNNYKIYSSYAF